MRDPSHQDVVIHMVEELGNVNIHHPVLALADVSLRRSYRIVRAPPQPKPVARLAEQRLPKPGSKIGCKTCSKACCSSRSITVGMPNSRWPPCGLGISTRRTGLGVQRPASSFARIFSPWRAKWDSSWSVVMPSMPAAPWLRLTAASARRKFSSAATCSITSSCITFCREFRGSRSVPTGIGPPRFHRFCLRLLPVSFPQRGRTSRSRTPGNLLHVVPVAPLALLGGPSALRSGGVTRLLRYYGFC